MTERSVKKNVYGGRGKANDGGKKQKAQARECNQDDEKGETLVRKKRRDNERELIKEEVTHEEKDTLTEERGVEEVERGIGMQGERKMRNGEKKEQNICEFKNMRDR